MITYLVKYYDKLLNALAEHIMIVLITLVLSVVLASVLTILAMYFQWISKILIGFFSMIYSIPSLALFAILIPVTGLGRNTAVIVLVMYNQYLLLRNFIDGLNQVDGSVIEAATGMGMSRMQILVKVRIPLSLRPLFTGIHLAVVSTIGIATIAATINAGGLGSILLDGVRTLNVNKILWGSILSAGLAIVVNAGLSRLEKHMAKR
ncbi:MAG: ABC transporter permease [Clostridiales bacterium]|nr:ABC transporter permease [Clostridiales bacterium]MDU3242968.1 ABC transporter permease [Clostridiales bacterium]